MEIQAHQKILFIGDSITDCGRERTDEKDANLGDGYVNEISAILGATFPDLALQFVNKGMSGDTSRGLTTRWDEDVTRLRPDWVSIMIGTNDVWRQFDAPDQDHIFIDEYEANLRQLISSTRNQLSAGLILMTPFFIEPSLSDPMRAKMDEYSEIVRKIARETGVHFADTQAAFDRVLEFQPSSALSDDRVHPNRLGHMTISCAWLKAVGWNFC